MQTLTVHNAPARFPDRRTRRPSGWASLRSSSDALRKQEEQGWWRLVWRSERRNDRSILTILAPTRVVFLQIVAEGIPSTADTHHHVAAQDPHVDRNLGIADSVLALRHVDHRELRRTRALLHDVANLTAKNPLNALRIAALHLTRHNSCSSTRKLLFQRFENARAWYRGFKLDPCGPNATFFRQKYAEVEDGKSRYVLSKFLKSVQRLKNCRSSPHTLQQLL